MKTKITILLLLIVCALSPCEAQKKEATTNLPKIENYTKGELEIKITSFGENNPITIGKITADGTIHFNFPELDFSKINEDEFWTTTMKSLIGANFCKDPNAVLSNENEKLVEIKYIYLYKYNQAVGNITPSTQKDQGHVKGQLGSTINWVYSFSETSSKANCSIKQEWKDTYSFNETTAYDLNFKKGWNLVSHTLKEIHEWEKDTKKGSLPKTKIVQSLSEIPTTMNWHLNYFANDEELEKRYQLSLLTPISNKQFKEWLPEKTGDFIRTSYEIGTELEESKSKNNIQIIFENGTQKMEVSVIDGAESPKDLELVYFAFEMDENFKREDKPTNYTPKKGEVHHISKYDENTKTTHIMSVFKDRIVLIAKGENMSPEQLWKGVKILNIETLSQ